MAATRRSAPNALKTDPHLSVFKGFTPTSRLASEPVVLTPDDVQELVQLLDQALPPFERRSG